MIEQDIAGALAIHARDKGIRVLAGSVLVATHGSKRVTAVDVESLSGGRLTRIDCDLVCVSGGWNPAVHLFSQARGTLRYDESLATFVPDRSPLSILTAGGVNGRPDLADALVSKKSDSLIERNVEQVIRLDVLNAINLVQSAQASVKLAKVALDFARTHLQPGGDLVVKVFQGAGLDQFQRDVRPHFNKVYLRKPKASRDRSREHYVVAKGRLPSG